jgi:hypothetical protein
MTLAGPLDAETQNLSLLGAFIRCAELPDLDDRFRVVIKPTERQFLLATAEKVWADTFINDKETFHGIGVCFTYIVDDDRQRLGRMISDHF